MSKKLLDIPDVLDESSLDEYGVWVKAGPDDSIDESDEFVSDLIDDTMDDLPEGDQDFGLSLSIEAEMTLQEPESGSLPDRGITLKGQEVADMSEQDKTDSASLTEDLESQDISLDASEELALSNVDDDDLGGLSDLLLNIDEDSDQDDTIYLEDDDLSFDLDEENEDLLLEQEAIDTHSGDDFGEDIVIPGLDDELNIEIESTGIEMPLLEGLDDLDSNLAALDDSLEESTSKEPIVSESNIETHGVEEVGLDEFLDDQMEMDSQEDALSLEDSSLSLDEQISFDMDDSELDLTSEPINEISLVDDSNDLSDLKVTTDLSVDDDSLDIDLGPEIDLDEDMIDADMSFGEQLPGTEYELDTVLTDTDNSNANFLDLESESTNFAEEKGFDDIAAVTSEFTQQPSQMREADSSDSGSSKILSSIEDELHAIRSELTDLRAELKKLRARDSSALPEDDFSLPAEDDDLELQSESLEIPINDSAKTNAAGGFFDDDEDETIALTGDELDNILNTAEFTEEAGEPSSPDLDEDTLTDEMVPVSAEEFTFSDSTEMGTPQIIDAAYEDVASNEDFAPIEEISLEEFDEESQSNPDPENFFTSEEPSITSEEDTPGNVFQGSENAMEQLAGLDIEKELAGIEDLKDEEEDIELYTGGELDSLELEIPDDFSENNNMELDEVEQIRDETAGEIQGLEEEPELITPNADESEGSQTRDNGAEDISFNLKQEIKAVLAYMDQLLESLPEEKIEEFARSEHFDVYKKLFDELGL